MSESSVRQRVGIYGGSFDPIHQVHLLIAEQAREQLRLDQVRFIPAYVAPHKLQHRAAEGKHRAEMIRLAIGGNPQFQLDERELQRGGTSFTVDTLTELHSEMPHCELVFIMGADSLAEFHTWREPAKICELAFVAVLARGGQTLPDMRLLLRYLPEAQHTQIAQHLLEMPQMELSSTDIRERVRARRSIRYQVPAAVAAYIDQMGLYQG